MLRKKLLTVGLLFCVLTALVGCSGRKQPTASDWSRYTTHQGMMMVTDEAYLFYSPEWQYIQATDLQCSVPAIPACTKAQCTHSDSSCGAYVDVPTYFYSWNNRVYYIRLALNDDNAGLYSMNFTGEDRKLETSLPQLDMQDRSLGYNFCIGDDYLLLYALTTDTATNIQNCQLFLFDMNDLKAEPVTIFSSQDSDCMIDHYMYVMDGWAFYGLYSSGKDGSLYGYEIATGETKELVQNWSNRNSMVVKDGILYWCAVNKGIYSVDLATGKSTEYQHFDTGDISGTQGYDDQYIYLSYLTDDPKVVIYDYTGNQIAETAIDSPGDLPIYFFCSADKAYFSYTGEQGADRYVLPRLYLDKADIAKGQAVFKPVWDEEDAMSAPTTPAPEETADALTVGCAEFSGVFSPFFAETTVDRDAVELTQLRLLPNDRSGMVLLQSSNGETTTYNGTEYTYYGPADLTIAEQSDGAVWYDISLRDDLCFSDGTELTVDDLIFSLYVLCDPSYDGSSQLGLLPIQGLSAYQSGSAASISGIQRTGDHSLRLVTDQLDQRTLYALSEVCIAPLHYYGDAAAYDYAKEQFGFTRGDLSAIHAKDDAPLGAGAYQFVSYASGTITYTANERYYRGTPATTVLRLYGQSQEKWATWPDKLLIGELAVSYFESGMGSMGDAFEQAVGNELTRQLVYEAGSSSYEYIGIDPERVCVGGAPDSDASKSLRRGLAVILAACRTTGLEQAQQLGLTGFSSVVDYPISSTTWLVPGRDDAAYRTIYDAADLTAAKQTALACFADAGYTVSDGAVTAAPEGASLSFEVRMMAYPDGENGEVVCDPVYLTLTAAQAALADLGITLDVVNTYDLNDHFPKYGDSDLWAGAWTQVDMAGWSQEYGVQPPLYTFVDPGIQLDMVYASNGGVNRHGFSDPELDALLTDANATADPNARKELYQNCMERIMDWAVEVPLYQSQGAVVFNNEQIDAATFPTDLTASYSWLREVEHISLN